MAGRTQLRFIVALLTFLGLIVIVAWYGWLEPPFLSYKNMPFEPLKEEYQAGQMVLLKVTRCNSTTEEQSYLISHRLVRLDPPPGGQKDIVLPPGIVGLDPGCVDEISAANPIPRDTPPGMYFVRGKAKVGGLWRTSYLSWSSRPFRVLAASSPAQ